MPIILDFQIEKTALLCQENPICHIVASNDATSPVKVAALGASPDVPILRIVDCKTGIETFQHRRKHGGVPGTAYQEVAAGGTLKYEFELTSIARLPLPVEYEVSAILPYEMGAKRAESKPARLRISPVTPRDLCLTYVQGGWAAIAYGVSVNVASDPPQIVRHRFDVLTEGGVGDARPVAKAPLRAAPVLSAPPNQSVVHAHWIAWRDSGNVAFTHFDAKLGALRTGTWACPSPEFEIVSPLATEPATDPARRPNGAALIWMGGTARQAPSFQVLTFTSEGKAVAAASCPADSRQPSWMMSHIQSTGRRILTYAVAKDKACELFVRPWPQAGAPGEARSLARWEGAFQGGGALLIADDSIRGATLVRGPQGEGSTLELITWKLNAQGEFAERTRHKIAWPFQSQVNRAVVRIGPSGKAVALLAGEDERWQFFDEESGVQPLPASVAATKLPVDVVFMGDAEPVLIFGRMTQGFELMMPNGDPLPGFSG
jgi:hypothetical protein